MHIYYVYTKGEYDNGEVINAVDSYQAKHIFQRMRDTCFQDLKVKFIG